MEIWFHLIRLSIGLKIEGMPFPPQIGMSLWLPICSDKEAAPALFKVTDLIWTPEKPDEVILDGGIHDCDPTLSRSKNLTNMVEGFLDAGWIDWITK